jgi:hypothetical protein
MLTARQVCDGFPCHELLTTSPIGVKAVVARLKLLSAQIPPAAAPAAADVAATCAVSDQDRIARVEAAAQVYLLVCVCSVRDVTTWYFDLIGLGSCNALLAFFFFFSILLFV